MERRGFEARDQACFHRYFPCHPLHAWVYNPRRGVPRYALSEPRSSSKFIRVARRARSLRQRTESFRALLFSLGFVTHRVHGTFIWRTRSRRHLPNRSHSLRAHLPLAHSIHEFSLFCYFNLLLLLFVIYFCC